MTIVRWAKTEKKWPLICNSVERCESRCKSNRYRPSGSGSLFNISCWLFIYHVDFCDVEGWEGGWIFSKGVLLFVVVAVVKLSCFSFPQVGREKWLMALSSFPPSFFVCFFLIWGFYSHSWWLNVFQTAVTYRITRPSRTSLTVRRQQRGRTWLTPAERDWKTSSSSEAAFHWVTRATCNIWFLFIFLCVSCVVVFWHIWGSSAATTVRERLAVCCSIIRSVFVGAAPPGGRVARLWTPTRLCRFCTIIYGIFFKGG